MTRSLLQGPHRTECGFPIYDGVACECATAIEREASFGLVGQRMAIHLPPGIAAQERVDDAGISYGTDGSRTAWWNRATRLSGPGWYVK